MKSLEKRRRKKERKKLFYKIKLYALSLSFLYLLVFIITLDFKTIINSIDFSTDSVFKYDKMKEVVLSNIIPIICLVFLIMSCVIYRNFKFDTKGSYESSFRITEIEDINYQQLTFLTTYIIPLIALDLSNYRYIIVLLLLLIALGIIYIKTDSYYTNPVLAILGFYIYRLSGTSKEKNNKKDRINIVVITRDKLKLGDNIKYIELSNRVYYVRKT